MHLKLLFLFSSLFFQSGESKLGPKQSIKLDDDGFVTLEWEADREFKILSFHLSVETLGYVGFGISPESGMMANSDIAIGGVESDGTPYFNDYYTTGVRNVFVDDKQNWFLQEAHENATHTSIKFWRLFDTFDADQDAVVEDDESEETNIIWSYSQSDSIEYHFSSRGASKIQLLRQN